MAARDNLTGGMPESLVILAGNITTTNSNLFFNQYIGIYKKIDITANVSLNVTLRGKGTYTVNTTNIDISDVTNLALDNPNGIGLKVTLHN